VKPRTAKSIQYKAYAPFLEPQQIELHHRCKTQEWVGVCDVKYEKYGRGLVSTQKIDKGDVIVDYHGLVVEGPNLEEHFAKPGVLSEFCLQIAHKPKRIIDASAESCEQHPNNRCLGRLANHALARKGSANMALADILLDAVPGRPRVVVFVARVDIEPLQQLRFDYNDKVARDLLKD
jgi:hypothetical protein